MYLAPICCLDSIRHNRANLEGSLKRGCLLATYTTNDSLAVIRTYPELAIELVKMMSSANNEIYLAPRYYEPSIGNRILAKFSEGVSVHVLDANVCGVSFEERIRVAMLHDSKNRKLMSEFLNSNETIMRADNLPYSFVVVDRRYCGLELTDPRNPETFFCALRFESAELAEELIGMFESLVQSASTMKQGNSRMAVRAREN